MKIITDATCTTYSHPGHPERPERISRTVAALRAQDEVPVTWLEPGPCPKETLLRAHTEEHLARLEEPEDFDSDTPYFPRIGELARASAGAALTALTASLAGETVFSLMRPPGHHATRNRAMGFCYLNNMALTVLEARARGIRRVGVFDFDVHHGNGTEAILLNVPDTAILSVHQYPCYPETGSRNVGNNSFNFPVAPATPRHHYLEVLESALLHLQSFKPDVVGVSAGFDAFSGDSLAQGSLEAEDFYWLGEQFRKLGIPVFSLLEGGYSEELPQLVLAYLRGLNG